MRALLLLGLLFLAPAAYAESVLCLEWCKRCNAGQRCVTDCLLQEQPLRNASCAPKAKATETKTNGIPCYDWCQKCKPADATCPSKM